MQQNNIQIMLLKFYTIMFSQNTEKTTYELRFQFFIKETNNIIKTKITGEAPQLT